MIFERASPYEGIIEKLLKSNWLINWKQDFMGLVLGPFKKIHNNYEKSQINLQEAKANT